MTKHKHTIITNIITVEKARKELPQLVGKIEGSKTRYFLSIKGKPQAVVLSFDDYLNSIIRSKRSKVLAKIQEEAKAKRLNKISLKEINAEVRAYRKEKK